MPLSADPRRLIELFAPTDRVLIVLRPDPDALGSALGVAQLLRPRVRGVTIARVGSITRLDNRAMVRILKIRLRDFARIDPRDFDRCVMVDSQPSHFGPEVALPPLSAVIDHHPAGPGLDGVPFVDIRSDQGACATIIEEYYNRLGRRVSARLATALCFGIKSDTGEFTRGVSRRDAVAFSRLFPDARHDALREIERWEYPPSSLPYVRRAFENLRRERSMILTFLGRVDDPDILVVVADFLSHVGGITLCCVAAVQEGRLAVSFRCDGVRRSARQVATAAFGAFGPAGGHRTMARAELPLQAIEREAGGLSDEAIWAFARARIRRAAARRAEGPPEASA